MTTRLTDEQLAELERLWTETRTEWRPTVLSMGLEKLAKSIPSLLAEVRVARSSSGSGEREAVHGEDVVHACAHAHGMGQEDGFRAGVEEAAKIVAGWHVKRGGYLVLAEAIRALSSAPPSPDSGERVRALEEALVRCEALLAKERRERDRIAVEKWRSEEELCRARGDALREAAGHFDRLPMAAQRLLPSEVSEILRALSPQGDGGTP